MHVTKYLTRFFFEKIVSTRNYFKEISKKNFCLTFKIFFLLLYASMNVFLKHWWFKTLIKNLEIKIDIIFHQIKISRVESLKYLKKIVSVKS